MIWGAPFYSEMVQGVNSFEEKKYHSKKQLLNIWIELYKSGLDSIIGYTNEKSAQISFLCMLPKLLHFYNMHVWWDMRLSRRPCLSCPSCLLLSWEKVALYYLLISFKCFSSQQLPTILKMGLFSLIIWAFLMVMYWSILCVVPSLARPKIYIPTSNSCPIFMVSAPSKITFFHTLKKAPLTKQVHTVSATQPRAALENRNLREGCQNRTWGESEPRQKKPQTN